MSGERGLITLLSDLFPGRLGHALTAREWAVLRLVADGAPAETIARRLGISHRTLHKHLEHLYRKLGVHDGAAAVHVAVQLERL